MPPGEARMTQAIARMNPGKKKLSPTAATRLRLNRKSERYTSQVRPAPPIVLTIEVTAEMKQVISSV